MDATATTIITNFLRAVESHTRSPIGSKPEYGNSSGYHEQLRRCLREVERRLVDAVQRGDRLTELAQRTGAAAAAAELTIEDALEAAAAHEGTLTAHGWLPPESAKVCVAALEGSKAKASRAALAELPTSWGAELGDEA
jgi:hypothetical protein